MEGKKEPAENRIIIQQTNILPKKERYKTIWYSQSDYISVQALSIAQRKPLVQVAHDLIANYLECQKVGHEQIIVQLTQERAILAAELKLYVDHFGKLPESARSKKGTPRE